MNYGPLIFIMTISLLLKTCASFVQAQEADSVARPPNIILIMADDLGYGDLSCQGSEVHLTPHIDRLAKEGTRFTDFYVTSAVCTPSRVAMLTGRHPIRANFSQLLWPTSEGGLPQTERTLARILKEKGYVTGLAGKWHLGHSHEKYLPLAHGFDSFYGMPYPNDMDPNHPQTIYRREVWPPMPMMRGNEVVEAPIDVNLLTQQYSAEAIRFIAENHHRPFFLLFAHAMPHTFIGASPQFQGTSRNGIYGDAIQELDWSVGEVVRTLRNFGIEDDTLIVFLSDNGAVEKEESVGEEEKTRRFHPDLTFGSNKPLRGGKQSTYEGGVRVPGIFYWPGRVKAGVVTNQPAWVADILPTFLDLAGLPLPQDRRYDGISLKELLCGNTMELPERSLGFGASFLSALRQGHWKLVLPKQPRFIKADSDQPMLYHLANDPGERQDLADKYPERAQSMLQALQAMEEEMKADTISR